MKALKIVFTPEWRSENPYQDLLADAITKNGNEVIFSNYPKTRTPLLSIIKKHPDVDIIHLHWIAPMIERMLWSQRPAIQAAKILQLKIEILAIKMLGKRIVWTIHNLYSHESSNKSFENRIRRILAKGVSATIFHSERNLNEFQKEFQTNPRNATIIPHGNYISSYTESSEQWVDTPKNLTRILFLGQIRRYKGIQQFAESFHQTSQPDLRLTIAGKVIDEDAGQSLLHLSNIDKRISYKPGFIHNQDISSYYNEADIVAIPFERTLTSGSAILAMSKGKVLMLPKHADVLGLPEATNIIYFSPEEIPKMLENLPSAEKLRAMGRKNLEVAKTLDWNEIGKKLDKVYRSL